MRCHQQQQHFMIFIGLGVGAKKLWPGGKWIRWSLIVLKSPQGISDMTHIPFSYAHHVQAVKESYFESMNCKTMQFENSSKTAIGPMAAMWVGEWIATFFGGGKPAELRTGSSGSSGSNLSTQNDRPQVPLFWLQISWFSCIARIACIAVILSYFISKIAIWGGFIMTKGLGPSMAALPSISPRVQLQECPLVYQARNGWFQRPKKIGFLVNWVSSYPHRNAKSTKNTTWIILN